MTVNRDLIRLFFLSFVNDVIHVLAKSRETLLDIHRALYMRNSFVLGNLRLAFIAQSAPCDSYISRIFPVDRLTASENKCLNAAIRITVPSSKSDVMLYLRSL